MIPAPDPAFAAKVRAAIDGKTKPPGSLGRIETLAERLALLLGTVEPRLETCSLTIFAADHGIARRGVSRWPQAITAQMALNFLGGGAAANAFAGALGVPLRVVDAGVAEPPVHPALIDRRMGPGTADSAEGPAMSAVTRDAALAAGRALALEDPADALAFGEMGIGNTAAASLLAAKLLGVPVEDLAGPGAGLDADGLARKRAILAAAAARTGPLTASEALAEYGGFEIAMMTGALLGAAEARKPALVDGFIAGAAALAAERIAPGAARAFVYAHRSAEPGHAPLLTALAANPLLDLGMRLGEGTGALLAWPLVKAAAAMLREMASFEAAGVSGPS
ncbi:MAG: nicotinate-nucleotide--dimethylbenzimidazole phosphoribosyltransferase [Paracoccaceae bacterium]